MASERRAPDATETDPTPATVRPFPAQPEAVTEPTAETRRHPLSWAVHFALAIFVFVLAIQMMKTGAAALAPRVEVTDWNAVATLGLGVVLAYLFLSGKPVAAFALSLFTAGGLTKLQTFTMISGGRLGAAFIVLLIGFLYSLRGASRRDSIGVGVLALSLTAIVYVPAMMLGYGVLKSGVLDGVRLTSAPLQRTIDVIYSPIVDRMASVLPDPLLLPLGGAVIIFALKLLDRALPEIDGSRRIESEGRGIRGRWPMFVMGFAITLVTISVSVALTLLVPLAAKGHVNRRQAIPYIMGANVATMIDTLIISVVYGNPVGVQIVLAEFLAVALVTGLLLAFAYAPLCRGVLALDEWVIGDRGHLVVFVGVIFLLPLVLLAIGFLTGAGTV